MARARNIKPLIMDNEELADLEPLTRLLFVYLWMLADREGRLEDRPKRIAAQALPYDRTADVETMLDELQGAGFIVRYVAADIPCIQIASFLKHQTPHGTERDSALPNEDGLYSVHTRTSNGYATGEAALVHRDLTVKKQKINPLIPDSGFRIPDSPIAPPAVAGEGQSPTKAGSICKAIKAKGVQGLNPSHPELLALIEKGVTVETFEAAAEVCAKSNPPKNLGYLLAIVKRQLNEAAEIAKGPAAAVAGVDPESRSAIEAEGVAKGIGPWNEINEQWHLYKARVRGARPAAPLDLNALAGMAQRAGVH